MVTHDMKNLKLYHRRKINTFFFVYCCYYRAQPIYICFIPNNETDPGKSSNTVIGNRSKGKNTFKGQLHNTDLKLQCVTDTLGRFNIKELPAGTFFD
jgi:hypothetical protein